MNTRNCQPQTVSLRPLHSQLREDKRTKIDVLKSTNVKGRMLPHLSHHAVPRPIDLLAVFSIGDQVKVVGELDRLGDLLQDIDAETLAATLDVNS